MPSGYLHKRCAEKACQAAGIKPSEKDVLILGAQGPDPLFVLGMFPLRLSSRPAKYGKVLHTTRTGAFLTALLAGAKDGGNAERAFALGFLTHYALDTTVHPYVYAHSNDQNGLYSSALHMRLEKHWDTLYYQADTGVGTSVSMPGVGESEPHWQAVAALWAKAAAAVYPDLGLTEDLVLKALADAKTAGRLTHSPSGIKYGLCWILERIIRKPYLITSQMAPRRPMDGDITNAVHAPWQNPAKPKEERREGLTELFDAGAQRATKLLTAAQAYFDGSMELTPLSALIGNLGYGTGINSLP